MTSKGPDELFLFSVTWGTIQFGFIIFIVQYIIFMGLQICQIKIVDWIAYKQTFAALTNYRNECKS